MDGEALASSGRNVAALQTWERWVAHAGYVAEGVLYLLIGTFALLATLDTSRHPDDVQGVLVRLSFSGPGCCCWPR